ncbi:hypothetical protein MTR67_003421 [Solanum verrucosum]|uniref:Uncharacterized protein n=1 Tax=Solanum verrucosum TaxID=315347 RepID=A0AAF0PSN8_SOLVR|nr:hypothetical protein MTR67_003421 [Solanum verrucosum]
MSTKTSTLMTWHKDKRVDDGIMRHPADSMAWKSFDELHPSFAAEPRNVRLGLASDGFQPFRNSKTSHSIWPVVLIPYNLPPWLCMKQENFILSMLIPGPTGPGDAIDTYLQPLIEELKELWDVGVETYDASAKQNFKLHASLLWTINDFPAYGNLSGWSTKGKLACPCCNKDTSSTRLTNCKKQCFMGHRRYLSHNHKWRNEKESFDGTNETRPPPKVHSGTEILNQVEDLEGLQLSKDPKKRKKISHENRKDNWNKKSIFFELPYWKCLLLRHNLDVMHIEKNICDNIIGTIMNVKGKTKDTIKTRLDLQEMNIRPELHPIQKGEKIEVPTAYYTLSHEDKHKLCLFLKNLKVPDGFSSNISQCVNLKDHKISGLKSHDCHVLLQHLLPLALRAQIPITLCKLEKVFPPSFFDVMVHLPIHLATEAKIAGPIHYRWMYPVERWLYFLKSLIGNRACPEGCIAEGYIAHECMTLCSRYLHRIETKFNRPERNYDGGQKQSTGGLSMFCQPGKTLGAKSPFELEADELEQAHIYILKNCDEVLPYLEEFAQTHENARHLSDAEWNHQFIEWFKDRVAQLHKGDDSRIMEDLLSLSRGPTQYSTRSNGYIVNGYRFHVEDYDKKLRTQNCGVVVVGENDKDSDSLDYYGVLTDVIELQFVMDRRVILFRCNWFDVYDEIRGVKKDEYDFVSVNPSRFLKTNEPFILADQASQVFYANDNSNKGWQVVRKTQPRDSFDIVEQIDDDTVELGSSSQKKRKRTNEVKIKMKSMKLENEVDSSILKSTIRYTFVAPGAIGKGRGRGQGLKSLGEKGHMTTKRLISDKSSDLVEHYIKEIETSSIGKGRGQGLKNSTVYTSQGMETMHKKSTALEKENMQINTPTLASTHQVKQYTQKVEKSATVKKLEERHGSLNSSLGVSEYDVGALNKSTLYANQKMQTPKRTRMNFTTSSSQEMQTIDRLVLQKEDMKTNGTLPPSTDQVMKHSQLAEKGSSNPRKEKRVRGSNKCKEVASLENGQKLKVTFYNNRTVGTNSNLFSRHLGKIVRDRNICPLGVSSWNDIKQEKLDHMWAAVENKFESVDMNDHRDHVLGWMNELWNKWRGYLHVKYVKDKPIQQSLKDIPKGVDKKEWEWLVKEHFASESFQARSGRNATNRAKLKMLHHIGSKPIREIIYQQGGKDGNPPNLATIFFETRKKDNKLVEPEAIEKHAQLEEMVQVDPSIPSIEIVEKCCGPQNRSHVFGFGGGVKAKDLKGGTSSKAELLSALRSTQEDNKYLNEENKSLNNRLSTLEDEMKEIRKMQELFAAQQSHVPPATSPISTDQ